MQDAVDTVTLRLSTFNETLEGICKLEQVRGRAGGGWALGSESVDSAA